MFESDKISPKDDRLYVHMFARVVSFPPQVAKKVPSRYYVHLAAAICQLLAVKDSDLEVIQTSKKMARTNSDGDEGWADASEGNTEFYVRLM